jgi:hypothetical protein
MSPNSQPYAIPTNAHLIFHGIAELTDQKTLASHAFT